MRWPVETPSRRQRSRPALTRSAEDADAFAEFYAAYLDRVLVYFTRRTYDAEVAGDLAAETFAVALERRRQFRGRTVEEEQGWLFAIARSQLSHFWRRGEVERSAIARLGLEPPDLPSSEIAEIERMAGVAEILRLAGGRWSARPRALGSFIIVMEGARRLEGARIGTSVDGRRVTKILR